MTSHAEQKRLVAAAALEYIADCKYIGVGSGTTVNCFIDALAGQRNELQGVVAASVESARRLRMHGIEVCELNDTGALPLYVDGADEATRHRHLLKGGGAALTREKIIAAASRRFVCIIDDSKLVDVLGKSPLPLEVIPMARSYVARELVRLGGSPEWRAGVKTDNGNQILDVRGLSMLDPGRLEEQLNGIAGVLSNGLFVHRPADLLLLGHRREVERI